MTDEIQIKITEQEQALDLARQNNDQRMQLELCDRLADLYSDQRNYEESSRYYHQAAALASQLKDANILFRLGIALSVLHEYPQSTDYLKQAIQISLAQPDNERSVIRIMSFLADLYINFLDDVPQAIVYYQQALSLAQKINAPRQQYWNLRHLGDCYDKLGDTQQAVQFYEQGIDVVRQTNDQSGEAELLTAIARVFAHIGDHSKSTHYFKQALATAQASGDSEAVSSVLIWWGNIYRDQGNFVESAQYYHRSLALARQHEDVTHISSCLGLLARLSQKQGQLQEAIDLYQQEVRVLHEDRLKSADKHQAGFLHFSYTNALESLSKLYEELGDNQTALDYMEQAFATTTLMGQVQHFTDHITRLRGKLNPHEADIK